MVATHGGKGSGMGNEDAVMAAWVSSRDGIGEDVLHSLCAREQVDGCRFAVPSEDEDGVITYDEDCGKHLLDADGRCVDPLSAYACPHVAAFLLEWAAG